MDPLEDEAFPEDKGPTKRTDPHIYIYENIRQIHSTNEFAWRNINKPLKK